MNLRRVPYLLFALLIGAAGFSACQPARNFTTYFNLFYNMERIMDEVEEELLYIREQKAPEPVFFVPFDDLERRGDKFYNHLERLSMNNEEMRANKIKLDSILIKGSKLMARDAKSDYLSDAVYYIAKTYFYELEWYQSQKKCEELIAGFPDSKWYPDAHLVLSMDLMHQGNVAGAQTMLSRTIDIAWGRERKDVLINAFRLNADLQLGEGKVDEALKPYQRAMVLSTDNEDLARWEYEIGLIYFRQGDFQKALDAYDKVNDDYSPDVLTEFQTGMQRAATLRALGEYDLAEKQLKKLRGNSNYEAWYGMVELEMLNLASARPGGSPASDAELALVDSASPGKSYSAYVVYERGVKAFREGDYKASLENFNKAKSAITPFQRRAQRYSSLLARYFEQSGRAFAQASGYEPESFPDSSKSPISEAFYNTARVFAALDIHDSLKYYYDLSYRWAAPGSPEGARVIYARSVMARDSDRTTEADSLLEIIVSDYPLTAYAVDARKRLNYTDFAKIDPAQDLYNSGVSHMRVGENQQALTQFQKVIAGYSRSDYAPMAYYAIGLLYERTFDQLDSAYSYYGRILDLYPKSEQAASVGPLIQAVNQQRMRQPATMPPVQGDGTGVNSDWMKENAPIDVPADQDEGLIPLNGDSTTRRAKPTPVHIPRTNPAGNGAAPKDGSGSGTVPTGTIPNGTVPKGRSTGTGTNGAPPIDTKPGTAPVGTAPVPVGTAPAGGSTTPATTPPGNDPAIPPTNGKGG